MMEPGGSRALAGAVLLVLLLGLLALGVTAGAGDALGLALVGGALIWLALARHSYGLLAVGCLLLGLGLGRAGQSGGYPPGEVEAIGLGVGFTALYLIDAVRRGRSHPWPLAPGLLLSLGGIVRLSGDGQRLLAVGWPMLLVVAGLALLAGGLALGRRL